MLIDAHELETGAVLEADVCVVGGGAGGITVARRLAAQSVRVLVLEGGGLEEEPESQALNEGHVVGLPYFDLDMTRFRVLGGSTGRWAGWCRPLDPLDFERRPWVAATGWPISAAELQPYYEGAAAICQLPGGDFSPEAPDLPVPQLYRDPFVGGEVRPVVWRGSPPTRFGDAYRDELVASGAIRVVYHANVVEIDTDDDGTAVRAVSIKTTRGGELTARASVFVLACDALETARLLLASRRVHREGVGNAHDNVGRYFIEHPHGVTGKLVVAPPGTRPAVPALDEGLGGAKARLDLQRPAAGVKVAYGIDPEVQQSRELLNYSGHLLTGGHEDDESPAYRSLRLLVGNLRSLRRLSRQIRERNLPRGVGVHLKNVALHPVELTATVYREILKRPATLDVYTQSEQEPNRDSRVTLADDRDALGVPRIRLDWRLSRGDKDSIRRSQEIISAHLERAGVGRIEPLEWVRRDDDTWGPSLGGGHHHLGTARMAGDPQHGVVDAACRVHGVGNLFIADGSVFPTGGFANPLLTIVALALRVADRVASELQGPVTDAAGSGS
jgi:choline dehydrogenase-like flavoprotein